MLDLCSLVVYTSNRARRNKPSECDQPAREAYATRLGSGECLVKILKAPLSSSSKPLDKHTTAYPLGG